METTRKDSVTLYSEHQRWKRGSKRFFEERKCKWRPWSLLSSLARAYHLYSFFTANLVKFKNYFFMCINARRHFIILKKQFHRSKTVLAALVFGSWVSVFSHRVQSSREVYTLTCASVRKQAQLAGKVYNRYFSNNNTQRQVQVRKYTKCTQASVTSPGSPL